MSFNDNADAFTDAIEHSPLDVRVLRLSRDRVSITGDDISVLAEHITATAGQHGASNIEYRPAHEQIEVNF